MPRPDGQFVQVRRDGAVELLRSSDGSLLLRGNKIVRSRAKSHVAVLARDRVEWFRSRDGERLGSVQSDFRKLTFSKDRPSSRLALQRGDGWELRRVEDGSLVMELTGADAVDLDTEFFFVSRQEGAEIRRLDDDSRELRRLLDVLDLGWLERATVDGITDGRLFALTCEGPLAGFDAAVLDERLGGDTWSGCVGIHL